RRPARSNTSSPSPSCRSPKDLADFESQGTPINEVLVRDLATGSFIARQRNFVRASGTGAGRTTLRNGDGRSQCRSDRASVPPELPNRCWTSGGMLALDQPVTKLRCAVDLIIVLSIGKAEELRQVVIDARCTVGRE